MGRGKINNSFICVCLVLLLFSLQGCSGVINNAQPDIYIDNYYNSSEMSIFFDATGLYANSLANRVGYVFEGINYVKVNNGIYRINNNSLDLVYEDDSNIQSIVSVGTDYLLYTTKTYNGDSLDNIKLKVYHHDMEQSEEFVEAQYIWVKTFLDENDFVINVMNPLINNSEEDYICTIDNTKISLNKYEIPDELPQGYYINLIPGKSDEDYVVCKKNSLGKDIICFSRGWILTTSGYVNVNNIKTNHSHKGCTTITIPNDEGVIYQHTEYSGNSTTNGIIKAYYCPTSFWEKDVLEKYDINTGEAKDFYSDSNNRILGYNYEENIVYLYSFSKNEIEAKDLDDNSITVLSSLEKAQTIKFTWCDKTLFWIYENDEVESYGGYLDL